MNKHSLFLLLILSSIQSIVQSRWPEFKTTKLGSAGSLEKYLDDIDSTSNTNRKWRSVLRRLIRADAIRTLPVLNAMLETDRGSFCCLDGECDPYIADYPMPLGCGATISEAWLHAICLEEVQTKLDAGAVAMDVGTGSG
jgi:protein-L-isoaspartate(D-aspartate) O-methyltransferase